jgi:hypothetical protein
MSVVAARTLIDELCAEDARLLIARDFDKAGFSIAGTLTRDTRRYEFGNSVDVVDLGIRLADVEEYQLESEPVFHRASLRKVEANLRRNGATPEEIAFLRGHRVELNAFSSDQFIEWLIAKLDEHGVGKVVPDEETLVTAYRRARMRHAVNTAISELTAAVRSDAAEESIPANLAARVRERLTASPGTSWDEAVAEIAQAASGDDPEDE